MARRGRPLATYGLAGVGGPLLADVGLPWRSWTLPVLALVFAILTWGARRLTRLDSEHEPPALWHVSAHVAVAASVLIAAGIGLLSVLVGIKNLSAIPQDWDAVFHANGIRWIVETGDGGLNGMTRVNWYGTASPQYYPNAYHLVAADVTLMSGRDIPSVLNSNTVLIPGVAALGLAALVRRCGGRAVVAGSAAVILVGVSAFYDMLWRGPLLPFAMGVALIPALLIVLLEYLRPLGWADRLPMVVPLALATAGLFGLHPGALIAAAVFAVALVLARWIGTTGRIGPDLLSLAVGSVVALVAVAPDVLGSLSSAAEASNDWPAVAPAPTALGTALLFGTAATSIQVWIALALAVGCLTALSLRRLRWLVGPAAIFVLLYVLATSSDAPFVETVTRPWWNDRYRLIGIAALPLAVIAAHGLGEASTVLRDGMRGTLRRFAPRNATIPIAAAAAAVVLGGYLVLTGGSYLGRNEVRMQNNTGDGPAVSHEELEGFNVLGRLVPPGVRVMNDRGDGSAWMYALAGVLPVAGHYNGTAVDADAQVLANRFKEYDVDPGVRVAAARLHIGWAVVDQGFLRPNAQRQPGLENLDQVKSLRLVYRNRNIAIYQLAVG